MAVKYLCKTYLIITASARKERPSGVTSTGRFLLLQFCKRRADLYIGIRADLAGFIQSTIPFNFRRWIKRAAAFLRLRKVVEKTEFISKAINMLARQVPDCKVRARATLKITLVRFRSGTRDNQALRFRIK